jgi:predicted nuclease with TOPRIM domain
MKETQAFLCHIHNSAVVTDWKDAFEELVQIIETMQKETARLEGKIDSLQIDLSHLSKKISSMEE